MHLDYVLRSIDLKAPIFFFKKNNLILFELHRLFETEVLLYHYHVSEFQELRYCSVLTVFIINGIIHVMFMLTFCLLYWC